MSRLSHGTSWKLLLTSIVLFALSLGVPTLWRRCAPPSRTPASQTAVSKSAVTTLPAATQRYEVVATPVPQLSIGDLPQPAPANYESLPPTPGEADVALPSGTILAAFAAPSQVAETKPPVAEQIDLDPSITETPALPAPPAQQAADPSLATDEPPALPEDHPLPEVDLPPTTPVAAAWPYPTALVAQLNLVAEEKPAAAAWTASVIAQVDQLSKLPALDDPAVGPTLTQLTALSDAGRQLAETLDEDGRSSVLRCGYAIVRRVSIWTLVNELALNHPNAKQMPLDVAAWRQSLDAFERRLATAPSASAWRQYLAFEQMRTQIGNPLVGMPEQGKLARQVLQRMHSTMLSEQQNVFLKGDACGDLSKQLQIVANEPADLPELLSAIEAYEQHELAEQSATLATAYQKIRWSTEPAVAELAETVNAYYRNANVRIALSAELVNRMLPKANYTIEPVNDVILGAQVSGESNVSTRLRLVLLPDRLRWRMGLEARGEVASSTASSRGPATFYQDGMSNYRARKLLTVDRRGIRLFNAEAHANSNSSLTDFETDFDGIPLFGGFIRNVARKQYDEASHAAKSEVEGRITQRASSQLDREVAQRLEEGKLSFQKKLQTPLRELDLEPTAVSMETTSERLIARYRLAGHSQVGAHSPRPQAPGDSLLSVQIHETAFNNALEHLNLQGRRVELRELYKELAERFSEGPAPAPPEDLPEDVFVTFGDHDPVRVDCQDGRLRLTINLQELSHDSSKWKNFTIRAYYAPNSNQLDANLVRDGVIELAGERLRFGDQVALRAIFSRVLSRNRKLELVNKQLAQSPQLQDQQVTQLVIHDGWLGLALGPKLPQREARMTPQPSVPPAPIRR